MYYDVSELVKTAGCKIVIADTMEMAQALETSVLQSSPKYNHGINDVFSSYKTIGPFKHKNKKTLWDILMKSEAARKNGNAFLMMQMQDANLYKYDKRIPAVMNAQEKRKASVMYDAMNGVRAFLINDCTMPTEKGKDIKKRIKESFCSVISWLKAYGDHGGKPLDLIWISNMSGPLVVQALGDEAFASPFYSVYKVTGDKVICLDKDAFDENFRKRHHAKATFQKARNYDGFFRTGHPQYLGKDNLQKAFALYKSAAEAGHPGARFPLAELYCYGREACTANEEKALYWYAMAVFDEAYDEQTADSIVKENRILARTRLKHLVTQLSKGRQLLRQYVGDPAEALIKEAEHEAAIQSVLDRTGAVSDQDYFNQMMKKALDRKR